MTLISCSKSFADAFRFFYLGWKALSLAALLIISLALWQLGVAGHEQARPALSSATTYSSLSANLLTSTAAPSTLRAPYDLALINADSTYYQRVDPLRLYQMAPIPAGQKRHEE